MSESLYWLPTHSDFDGALKALKGIADPSERFASLRALTQFNLDLPQLSRLDKQLGSILKDHGDRIKFPRLKVALLVSHTYEPLLPAMRMSALRRGMLLEIYLPDYNQYRFELLNPTSGLASFKPEVVWFGFHQSDVVSGVPLASSSEKVKSEIASICEEWRGFWGRAKAMGATVVHQSIVNGAAPVFGHHDVKIAAAPYTMINEINRTMVAMAHKESVILFDADRLASSVGKRLWCDARWWHHGKQPVNNECAPLYGDHVARVLAAFRGLSSKCLVLDLDNTVWSGVIGDDGLDGIGIGQGDATGEAFQAFQSYAKKLSERGVVLAVASKNDDANARLPFEQHPEMVLKLSDFASFHANWRDKATNLTEIAQELNLGLDSFVFFDDNPAERALIRQMLPLVNVPEVPDDPALYVDCLIDAGYFESISFTDEDQERTQQYRAEGERTKLRSSTQNLDSYLESLEMNMIAGPFDDVSVPRVAQLINKSNQFNLTTRRYTEIQIKNLLSQSEKLILQFRLKDRFGDNGIIGVVIGVPATSDSKSLEIDTWLMSCRVLGRQVENEVLNVLAEAAKNRGFRRLIGTFIPTKKNGLVKNHYSQLGFKSAAATNSDAEAGATSWELELSSFKPFATKIRTDVVAPSFSAAAS